MKEIKSDTKHNCRAKVTVIGTTVLVCLMLVNIAASAPVSGGGGHGSGSGGHGTSYTPTPPTFPPNVDVEPNGGGYADNGGPIVYMANNPITFTYQSDSTVTGVDINFHFNDGSSDINVPMSGGPTTWTYAIYFQKHYGQTAVTYTVHTSGPDQIVKFDVYVDPAGYVYDTVTKQRIVGAQVVLQQPDGSGGWVNVPINQGIMLPNQNPLTTDADGWYHWDVKPGTYRVHVTANGYAPVDSSSVGVPPAVTDLNIGLSTLLTTSVPEFPSVVVPVAAILGLVMIFGRKKE